MIFVLTAILISLDQLSKFIITKTLSLHQSYPIIKGIFHLTLIHNKGAAFGILKNQIPLFILTSLVAVILICIDLKANKHKKIYRIALSLILAGALGNLIDRLSLGYVVDFLDLRIWPVFNLADSAITIGAILLGWSILLVKRN